MADKTVAASATLRACGPTVSCECEMGITPWRLVIPTVGLIPTMPEAEDGLMIEPSVSVPSAATHRLAATATPEPELEPPGLRSRTYGLRVWRPRPLQPLDERVERKLAHSLILLLANSTAPASLSLRATGASLTTGAPCSANEPAVVCMRSAVSMLSLMTMGMPCSG